MKCGHTVIISGGGIDEPFAVRFLKAETYGCLIAADSGMEFLCQTGINPDVVIGDFDSVSKETAAFYEQNETIRRIKLNPIKDDTDTEAAVHLADISVLLLFVFSIFFSLRRFPVIILSLYFGLY